jgi:hypothetical protein
MTGRELIECVRDMTPAERDELVNLLPFERLSPMDRRALEAAWMHVPIGPIEESPRPRPPLRPDPQIGPGCGPDASHKRVPQKCDPISNDLASAIVNIVGGFDP